MQVLEASHNKHLKTNNDTHRRSEWGAYYGNNTEQGEWPEVGRQV